MSEEGSARGPLRVLIGAAAFVVVVAGLRAAAGIVVPFLLALFVAVICAPPLLALQEWRLPRWLALALVISAVVLLFTVLGLALGSSINQFTRDLPGYEARLRELVDGLAGELGRLGLPDAVEEARQLVDTSWVFRRVAGFVTSLGNLLTNALFILLTSCFILLEAASFRGKIAAMAADPAAALSRTERILSSVRRYLAIKTVTSLATGGVVAGGLALIGVDYPLLWGLLAFLLNFVPNIGSILAAVPGTLQALVQLGWGPAFGCLAIYLAVNLVIGTGIEPRVMGRSVGLSTLVVFMSLVFWGWVLGPVGMLLSVPLTMAAKIVLENDPSTRPLAVLLGPPVPEVEPGPGD